MSTFTHKPRAPLVLQEHEEQRHYTHDGKNGTGIKGIAGNFKNCVASTDARLSRLADQHHVSLGISTCFGNGEGVIQYIRLDANGLRELARCLIDAAHDIEKRKEAA